MKAMQFKLGNLELSIKAKDPYLHEKYNEKDTMAFINLLSILLDDSAQIHKIAYRERGLECYQKMSALRHEEATDLFHQLEVFGYYDDVKGEKDNVEN